MRVGSEGHPGRAAGVRGAGMPLLVATTALALLAAISPARAQVIRGYVVDDSTEAALPDVLVSVMVDSAAVQQLTTDTTGFFQFTLPDSGEVQLEGQRLGWRTVLSQPIFVPAGDTVSVELWMGVEAIPVAPLVVTARSNLGRSRFFRHMDAWGRGVFMTPDVIDSIAPIHPVDVLRDQEKTWLAWRMGRRKPIPSIHTYVGNGCVKFMINRLEVRSWAIGGGDVAGGAAFEESALEHLMGREIVAVEYYRYIGEVPPELRRFAYVDDSNAMCGLVVYWTREGW